MATTPPLTAETVAQHAYNTIDSTIPMSQWQAWQGHFDPACPPNAPYKSQKVDSSGKVIGGCEEKPDNCPWGTTAYGANQCLPVNDPKVAGAMGAKDRQYWSQHGINIPGGNGGGAGSPLNGMVSGMMPGYQNSLSYDSGPKKPSASGLYPEMPRPAFRPGGIGENTGFMPPPANPMPGGYGKPTISGGGAKSPLQGMLTDMFQTGQGAFGMKGGRDPIAQPDSSFGMPAADPKLTGRSLAGGGLLWADKGTNLNTWGGNKQPKVGGGGGGYADPTPQPVGAPPSPQVFATTPHGDVTYYPDGTLDQRKVWGGIQGPRSWEAPQYTPPPQVPLTMEDIWKQMGL